MFGRIMMRMALVTLAAVLFCASAKAEEPFFAPQISTLGLNSAVYQALKQSNTAVAPMPRAKKQNTFEIELSIGSPRGIELKFKLDREPIKPPARRAPDCCPKPAPFEPVNRLLQLCGVTMYDFEGKETRAQPALPPQMPLPTRPDLRNCVPHCGPVKVVEVTATDVCPPCPPCPFPQVAPNPLLGTWYRQVGTDLSVLTFTHDEMKLRCEMEMNGDTAVVMLTAHYTLTKDGLVFGAFTSGELEPKDSKRAMEFCKEHSDDIERLAREIPDAPFSFRVKQTSAGMMVSQDKCAGIVSLKLGGLYKFSKDGSVPTPAATKADPNTEQHPRIRNSFGIYTGGIGVTEPLSEPRPVATVPAPTTPPAPVMPPLPPVGSADPADPMKQMAADSFGQLMKETGVFFFNGSINRDSDINQEVRLPAVASASTPAKPGVTGTWYREIGMKRCVVKIDADHLTITFSETYEIDGTPATSHITFTADYHLTRDGKTAIGLITSVDAKVDGNLMERSWTVESVSEVREMLEEKPFAMTFRIYDNTLAISNVRLPSRGTPFIDVFSGFIGGHYAHACDKPLPKQNTTLSSLPNTYGYPPGAVPRVQPVEAVVPAMNEPTPPPLMPQPKPPICDDPPSDAELLRAMPLVPRATPNVYEVFRDDIVIVKNRLVDRIDPPRFFPVVGRAQHHHCHWECVVYYNEIVKVDFPFPMEARKPRVQVIYIDKDRFHLAPHLIMPLPKPPGEVIPIGEQPGSSREDLRQIENEWRRFWFSDKPSRRTPERVHGGID